MRQIDSAPLRLALCAVGDDNRGNCHGWFAEYQQLFQIGRVYIVQLFDVESWRLDNNLLHAL